MSDSRYRITERIAAGGMAEVFRGVAESIQGFRKNIAIKRVLPALTKNKKFVAMFLDEARLSLHLQHANIVQVFDIGHADETYFIVMEFVDGVDLKHAARVAPPHRPRCSPSARPSTSSWRSARAWPTPTRPSTPRPGGRWASSTATSRRPTCCSRATAR